MANEKYDLIVRNGEVIDGTGASRLAVDIGVRGDRVATLGDLSQASGEVEFDAANRMVAPGFIDVHTHDDHALLSKPDMSYKTCLFIHI